MTEIGECKDRQLWVEIVKFMEQELTSKNRSLALSGTMQYLSEGMDRYKLGRDIDFFLQIILVGSIMTWFLFVLINQAKYYAQVTGNQYSILGRLICLPDCDKTSENESGNL